MRWDTIPDYASNEGGGGMANTKHALENDAETSEEGMPEQLCLHRCV